MGEVQSSRTLRCRVKMAGGGLEELKTSMLWGTAWLLKENGPQRKAFSILDTCDGARQVYALHCVLRQVDSH